MRLWIQQQGRIQRLCWEEETKSMPHAPVMGYTMLQFKRTRENRYEIVKKLKENNVRDERKGLVFVFDAVSIGRSLVNNK
jgi:hypothetical protein